jgi:hypothetical protein
MIVIPSYKRPRDCITAEYLSEATIAVHDFQAEKYREHNENDLLVMPDDLQKQGMSAIRNWILDNTPEDEVLMIDDDIKYIGRFENTRRKKLSEGEVYQLINNGYRMAKELGTKLWGINLQSDGKFYREYTPFSLSQVVLGPFMGIIKDEDIRFDERLGLKEDYDYALQVLKKHRKILRFNKYHYKARHIEDSGGAATYRTMKKEQDQAELFEQKWGSDIVKIDRETQNGNYSINPIVKPPINGI